MLDFLFGSNVMMIISVVVIAFLLITFLTLMAEHEFLRWLFGIPLFIALVFSAVYSYGRIDNYYSSKGGVIGSLTALIDVNKTHINKEDDNNKNIARVDFNEVLKDLTIGYQESFNDSVLVSDANANAKLLNQEVTVIIEMDGKTTVDSYLEGNVNVPYPE